MANQKKEGKLGIALVGLGKYSTGQLAPALQETEHCYLAGIVTGSPDKAQEWKKKYAIPEENIYSYDTFDSISENKDIDIVYIVLPNSMHEEYVIRGARAGKHIISEKPLGITVEECQRMIDACAAAGKQLSVGYRLHFDPFNKEMMRLGQEKVFGKISLLEARHAQKDVSGWRLQKALAGGGPLMDLGIYCLQASIYTLGEEPLAVTATMGPVTDPERFREVEESLYWNMEFPGGIRVKCFTSYAEDTNYLKVEAEKGWFGIAPAYAYNGLKGETSDGKMEFEEVNQQALQMDDFALAVKEGRPTPVPGEMGKRDVAIMQAIYRAAKTGERVELTLD